MVSSRLPTSPPSPPLLGGAFKLPVEFLSSGAPASDLSGAIEDLIGNLETLSRDATAERLHSLLRIARSSGDPAPVPNPFATATFGVPRERSTIEDAKTAFFTRSEFEVNTDAVPARVLTADDNESSRDLLAMTLEQDGHDVRLAADGREAWQLLQKNAFDLVLLDIEMPRMTGFDVLKAMRDNERLRHVPVIVISGMDEMDSVVSCIEMGAEDHLSKPFNHGLLKARIDACLEKKRLRDAERMHLDQIRHEQELSEALLLNVLPCSIADRLKAGESPIADHFEETTILFSDLVGFTELSAAMPADELVDMLNSIFSEFDELADHHGVEKIKTIGDAYMVAGGLPEPRSDHAIAVAQMAIDMRETIRAAADSVAPDLSIRIGINTGPAVAGVIGRNKFIYDLRGDAVNVASRMESHGEPGAIQVSESTARILEKHFLLESRGTIQVKGKGKMPTFILHDARDA